MKITRVEPILVSIPYEHGAPKPTEGLGAGGRFESIYMRVDTDEGVTGWGEPFGHAATPVTIAAIRQVVGPMAVGRVAGDRAALMADLWFRTKSISRSGPIAFALSGLDTALWDIAGKLAGKPVWQLLGGAGGERKPRVPAYASLVRIGTPADVARVAAAAAERGYRHIKLHEHTVEAVAAAREAVGPSVSLMLDSNCFWSTIEDARSMAHKLKPHALAWFEEPLYPPDDFEGLARLRREADGVPIAAGENLGNAMDIRRIIQAGAVDVVQPSLAKMGGISEIWKAAGEAQARGARLVPHSPYSGVGLIATLHVIAAMPGDVWCEHRYGTLEASPLGDWAVARDGDLRVPDGPGLGVEIDTTVMERYRVA